MFLGLFGFPERSGSPAFFFHYVSVLDDMPRLQAALFLLIVQKLHNLPLC